jgi:hypothetical protein
VLQHCSMRCKNMVSSTQRRCNLCWNARTRRAFLVERCLSHGRPGREVEDGRLADDDTDKRGEEGMAGVADEEVLDDDTDKGGEDGMAGVALGGLGEADRLPPAYL